MKPSTVWSPSTAIGTFWRGRLVKAEVAAERAARNPDGRQAPCRDYLDSSGKRRFHGTPELKRTGSGPHYA